MKILKLLLISLLFTGCATSEDEDDTQMEVVSEKAAVAPMPKESKETRQHGTKIVDRKRRLVQEESGLVRYIPKKGSKERAQKQTVYYKFKMSDGSTQKICRKEFEYKGKWASIPCDRFKNQTKQVQRSQVKEVKQVRSIKTIKSEMPEKVASDDGVPKYEYFNDKNQKMHCFDEYRDKDGIWHFKNCRQVR